MTAEGACSSSDSGLVGYAGAGAPLEGIVEYWTGCPKATADRNIIIKTEDTIHFIRVLLTIIINFRYK